MRMFHEARLLNSQELMCKDVAVLETKLRI